MSEETSSKPRDLSCFTQQEVVAGSLRRLDRDGELKVVREGELS